MEVKIKKLSKDAVIPTYGTAESAGFDLYAIEDVVIRPQETIPVKTGLMFEVPDDHAMFLFPRSGVSAKTSLRMANCVGVIDSDYRGEVMVLLHNTATEGKGMTPAYKLLDGTVPDDYKYKYNPYGTIVIKKGDRIAQGIIMPVERTGFVEGTPTKTTRGKGGLGSTGK